jgi:hypothetical protein
MGVLQTETQPDRPLSLPLFSCSSSRGDASPTIHPCRIERFARIRTKLVLDHKCPLIHLRCPPIGELRHVEPITMEMQHECRGGA